MRAAVCVCLCDREPAGADTETDCVKAVPCISATALHGSNNATVNLSSSCTGHPSFVSKASVCL